MRCSSWRWAWPPPGKRSRKRCRPRPSCGPPCRKPRPPDCKNPLLHRLSPNARRFRRHRQHHRVRHRPPRQSRTTACATPKLRWKRKNWKKRKRKKPPNASARRKRRRKKRPRKKPPKTKRPKKRLPRTKPHRKNWPKRKKSWTRKRPQKKPRPTRKNASRTKPAKRLRTRPTKPGQKPCGRKTCSACRAWPVRLAAPTPRARHSNHRVRLPPMLVGWWAASNPTSSTPAIWWATRVPRWKCAWHRMA